MTELGVLERTLSLAREGLSPSAVDRARLRGLGLPRENATALHVAPNAPHPSPWTALRASGKVGMVVGTALLGAGVAIGFWLRGTQANALANSVASDMPRAIQPAQVAALSSQKAPEGPPDEPSVPSV